MTARGFMGSFMGSSVSGVVKYAGDDEIVKGGGDI
jgi:hypothetical protein